MSSVDREPGLWAVAPTVPEGFIYRPDFVAEDEERSLIRDTAKLELKPFEYYPFTGKRRTVSFGWQYEFGQSDIRPAADIPKFLLPVRARAGALFGIDPNELVHASVIEYSVGAPIGWHRDIPHFGSVIGISLGAACRMRFRKYQRGRRKPARNEILSIDLRALDLPDERRVARDLAAFDPAGEGTALRDHDAHAAKPAMTPL